MAEDLAQLGIRIPRDLHDRLQAAADERMLSLSYLVRKLLEEALDDLLLPEEICLTSTRRDALQREQEANDA